MSETDIEVVFALFDEIDAYIVRAFPHAMKWIGSELDVRFDVEFMEQAVDCLDSEGDFEKLVNAYAYRQSMIDNMDY